MKTILLIEDDDGIRDALILIFTAYGYKVNAYVKETDVPSDHYFSADIIFLDVLLPGINGVEICRFLKESEATKHIPVILVSASPRSRFNNILEWCEDEFVEKPFNAKKMRNIVEKYT